MAVVIQRPYDLIIDSADAAESYLTGRVLASPSPFAKTQAVRIIDRSSLTPNIAFFDVGVVIECPPDSPVCFVLVLTTDLGAMVVAVPKGHLVNQEYS